MTPEQKWEHRWANSADSTWHPGRIENISATHREQCGYEERLVPSMTPEQKKAIEDKAIEFNGYANPMHPIQSFKEGAQWMAEWMNKQRDEEVERLKEENAALRNEPSAVTNIVNVWEKELDTLKKQVEEMKEWPSKRVSVSDGIYWLIEERGVLRWLMSDGHTWTTDANKAAKYPSQYEATLERERRGLTLLHYTVTEHQWLPLT